MIIDRFEGEFAIIEIGGGITVNMPKLLLPENAKEGDVIKIIVDEEETSARENRIKNKMNRLFCD